MPHHLFHSLSPRPSHRLLAFLLVLALLLAAFPAPRVHAAAPAPVLDQSFTQPSGASAAINGCCRYLAQTFTAGLTGALTQVSVDVLATSQFFLKVAIHGVTNGLPNSTIYSDAYVWDRVGGSPLSSAPLTLMIDIGPVYVVAGQQYAIVVDYEGSGAPGNGGGTWAGAPADGYPAGAAYQTNDETFATWDPAGDPQLDLHFKTYVVPNVPVSDLAVSYLSGARHAKACQLFDVTFRIKNLGPDPARHVALSIGVTDQFDVMSIDGQPLGTGASLPDVTLAPGETVDVTGTIKVTAFVPTESRAGMLSAHAWSEVWPDIAIDPNEANDYYFGSVRLISKGRDRCP